jgi:predicted DNA-binding antitoxin AbrB/MazE fold protein
MSISKTIEAVFTHGAFHPASVLDLPFSEGQKVRLVVEPMGKADEILALAAEVYEGLTNDQIDEIEKLVHRREDFFGERQAA